MLNNKILVNLYVVKLDKNYEIFLPVDEKIGNAIKLLSLSLFGNIDINKTYTLLNLYSGNVYNNNDLIRNTDIQNGTKLILF